MDVRLALVNRYPVANTIPSETHEEGWTPNLRDRSSS
jgi:hypothetical protein